MSTERSWFFSRAVIGVAVLLAVAQVGSFLLHIWIEGRVGASSRLASDALYSASKQITPSDESISYTAVLAPLQEARNRLQIRSRRTRLAESFASALQSASFISLTPPEYATRAETAVVVATETLSWLASASPTIALIAGYNAARDVHAARDARDLFGRLYAARIGMTAALDRLASPPSALPTSDIIELIGLISESVEAADIAIRAIDTGAASDEPISRFIESSSRASQSAASINERLTGEPFRETLRSLLQ